MQKSTGLLVALGALVLIAAFSQPNGASGHPTYYTNNCQGCHGSTATCAGCHSHGVHSGSAKDDININGVTTKSSYTPGETVSVTINGGYRSGWVRAILYDQNMVELARSTGPSGKGGGASFPITLTGAAPTIPGNYTWNVAWYGNKYDLTDAGSGTWPTFFGPRWTPDPGNPNHGREIVSTNSFTVTAPAINLNPSSLNFGTVTATSTSTLTTQVQNTSNALLNITSIVPCTGTSTEFTWTPSAPFSVSVGGSQNLAVTYAPGAAGSDAGCLQLSSDDPVINPATLNLSGTGVVLQPVRINCTVPTYFSSLQLTYNAYKNAPDGSPIQAQAVSFTENIDLDGAVAVTLQGGFDAGFSSNVGYTTIIGTFTINSGTAIMENFVIF